MKWSAYLTAFKTRWGLLYTADKAVQWGTPYVGIPSAGAHDRALCPLCHRPYSNTHMMGGCEANPFMKGLYIKRHDKAVLMLAGTIAVASMGQSTIFVDAGRHDDLPDSFMGKAVVSSSIFRKWLLFAFHGTSVLLLHLIMSFYLMLHQVSLFKCSIRNNDCTLIRKLLKLVTATTHRV
jgi:hypothetical protein